MVTRGSVGDPFDQLRPREQRKLAVKYFEPLARAKKILAWVDGNHERRTRKESDEFIGEEICHDLGIPSVYSPDAVMLFLSIGYDSKHNKKTRNIYTIYMTHGWSGARTIGGKFNNVYQLRQVALADIYICSHVHQKGAFPLQLMIPDNKTKTASWKKQLFVSTASFMEYDGYAIQAGYSPTTMGAPCITMSGRRKEFHALV